MSVKSFFLKQVLRAKGVPKEQVEQVIGMFEKDPVLFKKISEDMQAAMKSGKDQNQAMMEIAKKYQGDLKNLM